VKNTTGIGSLRDEDWTGGMSTMDIETEELLNRSHIAKGELATEFAIDPVDLIQGFGECKDVVDVDSDKEEVSGVLEDEDALIGVRLSKTESEKSRLEIDEPEMRRLLETIERFVELKDVILARMIWRVEGSRRLFDIDELIDRWIEKGSFDIELMNLETM
jgi:hypothetical protein